MKRIRISLGLLSLALLILSPTPVATRQADMWATGDLFVGIGTDKLNRGRIDVYDAGGNPRGISIQIPRKDAGYTTGCYYNPELQTLFATTFSGRSVIEFDGTTPVRTLDLSSLGPDVVAAESIGFTPEGDGLLIALPYSTPQLVSYAFSAASGASNPRTYTLPAGIGRSQSRVDWIDVARENGDTVVYYTDESAQPAMNTSKVYRYVPATGERTVFATVPEGKAYALRLLPGGSGLLVAGYAHIYRFNMQGQEVFRYFGVGPDEGAFFALNITPDGRHFWTATADSSGPAASGRLHKFNITASRHPVLSITTGAPSITGLCLKLEYTAARNVCSDPATGQAIPCPRLEVCTEGADDDGDGLNDLSDPDCVPPGRTERCDDLERADENRNGLLNDGCATVTPERSSVNLSFASQPVSGDTITYSAQGLPPGLTMAANGTVSGTTLDGTTGTYTVTLTADRSATTDTVVSHLWTVSDLNRAPSIASSAAAATGVEGQSINLALFTATDPDTATDQDGWTFSALGLPNGLTINPATGVISGTLAYDAAGAHDVTITVTDDHAGRSTAARPLQQLNLSASTTLVMNVADGIIEDRAPSCAAAQPSLAMILWPPNGKLADVSVLGVVDPDGDAVAIRIDGIHQDEPTNITGDGSTPVDGAISVDGRTAFVRAERAGTTKAPGDGRVYEILFTATARTLSCSGIVRVGVPFDRRKVVVPIRSPATYDSLTGARIN